MAHLLWLVAVRGDRSRRSDAALFFGRLFYRRSRRRFGDFRFRGFDEGIEILLDGALNRAFECGHKKAKLHIDVQLFHRHRKRAVHTASCERKHVALPA